MNVAGRLAEMLRTQTLRVPTLREAILTLAATTLSAAVCWFFGVDVWHAILLGCAITVIAFACLVGSSAPDARDISWRPGQRASREGSRSDVASLSASLRGDWGMVGLTAERRLHQIARRRLALEGLDIQNADHRPAIEQRIGTPAYRALMRRRGGRVRLRALLHCLDMLDAVDSTHYPVPPPRSRRWDPPAIPFTLRRARER